MKNTEKGKLIILATGTIMNDVVGMVVSKEKRDRFMDKLGKDVCHWDATSIFVDTYEYFDCRHSQTKINKLFSYQVFRALKGGKNVIIICIDAGDVDKRLRQEAMIFSLPQKGKGI